MNIGFCILSLLALIMAAPSEALAHIAPLDAPIHSEADLGPLLSLILFLPLAGSLLSMLARFANMRMAQRLRWLVLAIMGIEVALAVGLYFAFGSRLEGMGEAGFPVIHRIGLSASLGIEYFIGIDGLSLAMVLLTSVLALVGVIVSFPQRRDTESYWASYCLSITGILGVFVSLDLLQLLASWLLALAPLALMIGRFGETEARQGASRAFIIQQIPSAAFLLLGIIALYLHSSPSGLEGRSFAIPALAQIDSAREGSLLFGISFVKLAFTLLFLGCIGTFVPYLVSGLRALVEAPTAVSILIAGLVFNMGGYGILRICFGILPEASAWAAPTIAWLGIIVLFYGAILALRETDLKRLVAYAACSQMGFTLLGMASLTPAGIQGSMIHIFGHGLMAAMLFTVAGLIQDRGGLRDITRLGGLAQEMPGLTLLAALAFWAGWGGPGMASFIGEMMSIGGALPVYAELSLLGVAAFALTAAYHLRAFRRVFLGGFREEWRSHPKLEPFGGKFPEVHLREVLAIAPLVALSLILGFYPRPLLTLFDRGALDLADHLRPLGPMQISFLDTASQLFGLSN